MASVLAFDLGSTQLKLLLMDENACVQYVGTQGYETQAPRAGWLQQNPADWTDAMRKGMAELREKMPDADIRAVSFSGHMSGMVLLDHEKRVLYPCIMLSDSRSDEECGELNEKAGELIRRETGNPVINAFTLPKLLWLKKHEKEIWEKTEVWIAPKDYLRLALTGEVYTDCTDAYNSLAVSAKTAGWCPEIIERAGLEKEKFARILEPFDPAGKVTEKAAAVYGIPAGTPVFAGGADMACGALGMSLFKEGDSALTLGTCATFLAAVDRPEDSEFGKVTFHLHAVPGLFYALGSHFNGGLAVNWASGILSGKGTLDYGAIASLSEGAQQVPPGSNGLLTIPFLAGSGSPYFCAKDRQTVFGMNPSTTAEELFRSELEGITCNLAETKFAFDRMLPHGLNRVLLGGGGSKIGVWPQMIADVFNTPIDLAQNADASTVGAAIIAGVGCGMFRDPAETSAKTLEIRSRFLPDAGNAGKYRALYEQYLAAYRVVGTVYGRN